MLRSLVGSEMCIRDRTGKGRTKMGISEIEAMRQDFERAHSATSFSPERRADQCVRDFSAELEADLVELGDKTGNYKEKYLAHLRKWTAAKSRTMSPMITGSSNFPAERNRKAFERERRAWEEFQAWRERYIKRANRVPTKTPEEEIDDALIRLEKERNAHTLMVEVNKIHRRKVSDEEKRKAFAEELELTPEMVEKMMEPDCYGQRGFASCSLTNSNARIKLSLIHISEPTRLLSITHAVFCLKNKKKKTTTTTN